MNGDGRPGQRYVPRWDAPPPPLPPNPDPYPHGGYNPKGDGPVMYLPVLVDGELVGYLWGSDLDGSAGFLRSMSVSLELSLDAAVAWGVRLDQAHAEGLTPTQALTRWIGAPPDRMAGAIPADATLTEAPNWIALDQQLNPGSPPDVTTLPRAPWGYLRDGTPLDRSLGWEPKIATSSPRLPPHYLAVIDGPVRYLTVTRAGRAVGYLWAAVEGNAASYEKRGHEVEDNQVKAIWLERLDQAAERGLPALEAVRGYAGWQDDGAGAVGTEEREAPSLEVLQQIARTPDAP